MERCPMKLQDRNRKGFSGVKPGFRRVSELKLQPPEDQFFEGLLVACCAWVCSNPALSKKAATRWR
jgi:hypothetical protein